MPVIIRKHSHLDFVIQSAKDTTAFGGTAVAYAVRIDDSLVKLVATKHIR